MIFNIPIKIVSEANLREHWTKGHKRHKIQDQLINWSMRPQIDKIKLPCKLLITRIAPRELDFDNLAFALKHPVDVICGLIIPGLRPGRADGTGQIKIEYFQRKGKPKEYALEIEVESL